MPIHYARRLVGPKRSADANQQLGFILCFVAGTVHALGIAAMLAYSQHATDSASTVGGASTDFFGGLAVVCAGGLLCFVTGAVLATGLVGFARHRKLQSEFALPLLLEALLLLLIGIVDAQGTAADGFALFAVLMALSLSMGIQNAAVTLMSNAEIRTTNIFPLLIAIGSELGQRSAIDADAVAGKSKPPLNNDRLALLNLLALYFFLGLAIGWLGFEQVGFAAILPFAITLAVITAAPVIDDLMVARR